MSEYRDKKQSFFDYSRGSAVFPDKEDSNFDT